jgi:hypothetical protein
MDYGQDTARKQHGWFNNYFMIFFLTLLDMFSFGVNHLLFHQPVTIDLFFFQRPRGWGAPVIKALNLSLFFLYARVDSCTGSVCQACLWSTREASSNNNFQDAGFSLSQ